jgi:hypothetical protein
LKELNDLLERAIRRAEAAGELPPTEWREALERSRALLDELIRDEAEYAMMMQSALAE